MPRTRLTKSVIEPHPHPQSGQIFLRDTTLPGFGVRVGKTAKTYFAEGQVRQRTVRTSIGRADVITPDIARKQARTILAEMAAGHDPRQPSTEKILSAEQAFKVFFEAKSSMSPRTKADYRRSMDLHFPDWRNRPIEEVTRCIPT